MYEIIFGIKWGTIKYSDRIQTIKPDLQHVASINVIPATNIQPNHTKMMTIRFDILKINIRNIVRKTRNENSNNNEKNIRIDVVLARLNGEEARKIISVLKAGDSLLRFNIIKDDEVENGNLRFGIN